MGLYLPMGGPGTTGLSWLLSGFSEEGPCDVYVVAGAAGATGVGDAMVGAKPGGTFPAASSDCGLLFPMPDSFSFWRSNATRCAAASLLEMEPVLTACCMLASRLGASLKGSTGVLFTPSGTFTIRRTPCMHS